MKPEPTNESCKSTNGPPDDVSILINIYERNSHRDVFTSVTFAANGDINFEEDDTGSAFDDFYDCTSFSRVSRFPIPAPKRDELFAHFLGADVPATEPERRTKLIEVLKLRLKNEFLSGLLKEAGLACAGKPRNKTKRRGGGGGG